MQIGHPETFKLIPFVQLSLSKFEIEKTIAPNIKADSALTAKQITGGLIVPIKKIDNIYIRARFGYSYSMIKESFYNIDANLHGFQVGLGIEKKIIGNSRIY